MNNTKKILLIEDDLTFLSMLSKWLTRKGFDVITATSLSAASSAVRKSKDINLILSDMRLPDGDGIEIVAEAAVNGVTAPLIIMTGYADVQNAVNAMKRGASDYIAKPFQPEVLLEKINDLLSAKPEIAQQPAPSVAKVEQPDTRHTAKTDMAIRYLEGTSPVARELYKMVDLVAPTPMSVLVRGANGTGKEYVARRIHQLSRRADGPFIAIDCGVLNRELAASELFGHVKGAFTGAVSDKEGAFAKAKGGTLFLDEMGNLSYEVQVQLLRAIQERKIRPVGSAKEIDVDVRLICATNADLEGAIAEGKFREDLYHRINEFSVRVPLLRERSGDIMMFAESFLHEANVELERDIPGFTPEAEALMLSYPWEGNLRQLRNVVKRAVLLTSSGPIVPQALGITIKPVAEAAQPRKLYDPGDESERIISALQAACGNKARAARMLGVDRKTLYNKIRTLGIDT